MPVWRDETVWTPAEAKLRDSACALFRDGYSRDELKLLLDKALIGLVACEWGLKDDDAYVALGYCKPTYILHRNKMGFTRYSFAELVAKDGDRSELDKYILRKAKKQRELLEKMKQMDVSEEDEG
jgi:hypothetical protein